jgi:CDGSH-type Zn-finger protein
MPSEPKIRVTKDGPYVVDDLPVARKRMVVSENGEPIAWQTEADLDAGPTYILCRCGQSATKPFCDGTHKRVGFDGTEAAAVDTYGERARTLGGTGIVVRDDRSICEHAGFCGNKVTNAWRMIRDGDTAEPVARAQLIAMIERCPSGALTYRLDDDGDDVEPDLRPVIGVVADGPLWVTGRVTITRADGEPFETRARVTLCRCGASKAKPLCDGTHKEIGFADR